MSLALVNDDSGNEKSIEDTGENLSLGRGGCGLENRRFSALKNRVLGAFYCIQV
jgi:hypothetical protein